MKRVVLAFVVITAMVGALFGSTVGAVAQPTKTKTCSSCHGTSAAVKIKLTKKSSTAKTRKYSITITGGKGTAGWAVFSGKTNIAHKVSSKGTVTLKRGKTYKIRAVKTDSGAKTKTFTVPK